MGGIMDGDTHTHEDSAPDSSDELAGILSMVGDEVEASGDGEPDDGEGFAELLGHKPKAKEETEEETTPEEQEEVQPEEEEADEPVAELDFKNPKAAAKAYAEMTERLRGQSEVLKDLKEILGVTSRKDIPAALKARLESAAEEPLPVTLPTPDRPLANVSNEAGLADGAEYYQSMMQWCAQNPEGGECPFSKNGAGEHLEVGPEWVSRQMEFSKRVLFPQRQKDGSTRPSLLEQRRTQLQATRQDSTAAAAAFPFFAEAVPANAPEHVKKAYAQQRGVLESMARDIMAEVPEITHYSGAASFLGDAAVGRLIRQHGFAAAVKDGRVILNALTSDKAPAPKAPVKSAPVTRASATPPPARKAGSGQEEAVRAALDADDMERAAELLFGGPQ